MTLSLSRSAWAFSALTVLALAASCSFVLDYSDAQCNSNDDCAKLGETNPDFLGMFCSADKVCVSVEGTGGGGGEEETPCTTSEECVERNAGAAAVCRDSACVSLVDENCKVVLGTDGQGNPSYLDPDAIILGMIAPSEAGPPPVISTFMRDAIQCLTENVTLNDFAVEQASGIPNNATGKTHPIAIVVCEENDGGVPAAQHLVDTVGVKVVIGPLFGDVLGVARDVTIPAEVFNLIPSSPVPSIASSLATEGLVYTVMQSHGRTMRALGKYVEVHEAELRVADPGLGDIRVALTNSTIPEDLQIAAFLLDDDVLRLNDATANSQNMPDVSNPDCPDGCFKRFNEQSYVDTEGDGEIDYTQMVDDIIAFEPHVIVIITGDAGVLTKGAMHVRVEDAVAASGTAPEPLYLINFPDPALESYQRGVVTTMANHPRPGSAERFLAVSWPFLSQDLFDGLAARMTENCPASTSFFFPPVMEYWYDSVILAILSYVANGNADIRPDQIQGIDLASAMVALAPDDGGDQQFDFKPSDYGSLVSALTQGQDVDVKGVSGDLKFDASARGTVTEEGTVDMNIMCLAHTPGDPPYMSADSAFVEYAESGLGYDFDGDQNSMMPWIGTFMCPSL